MAAGREREKGVGGSAGVCGYSALVVQGAGCVCGGGWVGGVWAGDEGHGEGQGPYPCRRTAAEVVHSHCKLPAGYGTRGFAGEEGLGRELWEARSQEGGASVCSHARPPPREARPEHALA